MYSVLFTSVEVTYINIDGIMYVLNANDRTMH